MRLLFVMDDIARVLVDEDTSFALMEAAQERGHRVDHCLVQDVMLEGGEVRARVRRATMQRDPTRPIMLAASEVVALSDMDVVWIRKDPPFDSAYLWLTLLLEHVRERCVVLNDPRGLREANEKIYACLFPELMPETLIASARDRIRAFVDGVGGRAVIKPIDGHGGGGVFALASGDENFNALVEAVTDGGRRIAMVQRHLPEVRRGDKRILLLDGEPLGAILRVPTGGDLRSNIHVGGRVEATTVDEADMKIIETMRARLRADGLVFVGLDVIGGLLTEVNVTSPTGIQQMSRFDGAALAARVIAWCETRV